MNKKTKKKVKYIELEVLVFKDFLLCLLLYPIILFLGLMLLFFNFIVLFIPILNIKLKLWECFDNGFIFDNKVTFRKIKKIEVKEIKK